MGSLFFTQNGHPQANPYLKKGRFIIFSEYKIFEMTFFYTI